MFTLITLICLGGALLFPTLMITFTYPLSHKWALFWSNYITTHTDRIFFAILKYYRSFKFLADKSMFKKLPEQFIVISNHQSLVDIVVYLLYFQGREVRFVAKDSLGKVPMVGKMLKSQGHCMIPRRGGASIAMKALSSFGRRVLERKQIPVIFPEGTRSRDGELGTFYAAGFRRLEDSVHLPVAVCALDGGWKLSRFDQFLRSLKKGAYKVKVLKIFDAPVGKEEEKRILEEGKFLIQRQLEDWRNEEKSVL